MIKKRSKFKIGITATMFAVSKTNLQSMRSEKKVLIENSEIPK